MIKKYARSLRAASSGLFLVGLFVAQSILAAGSGGIFLTGPNQGEPLEIAKSYLLENHATYSLAAGDLEDFAVSSQYVSSHTGTTHIALKQRHQGIGVFNAIITVNIARDGSVINVGNRFVDHLANRIAGPVAPAFGAHEAIERVADHLGLHTRSNLELLEGPAGSDRSARFSNAGISRVDIPARLVYQSVGNQVRLAWAVQIHELRSDDYWNIRIDAQTGEELARNNLTVYDTFQPRDKSFQRPTEAPILATCGGAGDGSDDFCVYAMPHESPHHSDPTPDGSERTMESDPWTASATASPLGWNDMDGVAGAETNTTEGNNADAQKGGAEADGGADRIFNFDLDLTVDPTSGSNVDAAIANLYFWNNIVHDLWGDHGFDEVSGNFQEHNYSGSGVGGDSVIANAQAPGNCNANMATPADGENPTMNMFTCNIATPSRDGDFDNGVIAHEYWHGISNRLTGGPNDVFCLNNSEQAGEGWSDLGGLLMTINPGDTGADARGIGTWLLGEDPSGPGVRTQRYSTDFGVNTLTYGNLGGMVVPHGVGEVWATIYWQVTWALIDTYGFNPDPYGDWSTGGNNLAMRLLIDGLKLQPCSPGFVDNRDAILAADQALTGGANQCLLWEAFALRGLGFSATQGSTSSTSDGTEAFDIPVACDYLGAVPSTVEICAGDDAIFDITLGAAWAPAVTLGVLNQPAGTSADFSVNPVVSVPGASQLTLSNTAGLGNSSSSFEIRGEDTTPETFDLPVSLVSYAGTPGAVALTSPTDGQGNVATQPTLMWDPAPNGGAYDVQVATDSGFTSIVASVTGHTSTSWALPVALDTATTYYWRVQTTNPCGTTAWSASFEFVTTTGPGDCNIGIAPTIGYSEGFEAGEAGWTTDNGPGLATTWALQGDNTHTGSFAFHADDLNDISDQYLISPVLDLPTGQSPLTARFWTRQELEDGGGGCFDGAVVEISENGVDWTRLESELLTVPYDGEVDDGFNNPIALSNAWCGDPREWEQVIIDLDAWEGADVQLRVRLATDSSVSHPGMQIDDFEIRSCSSTELFADGFESGDPGSWSSTAP